MSSVNRTRNQLPVWDVCIKKDTDGKINIHARQKIIGSSDRKISLQVSPEDAKTLAAAIRSTPDNANSKPSSKCLTLDNLDITVSTKDWQYCDISLDARDGIPETGPAVFWIPMVQAKDFADELEGENLSQPWHTAKD